MYQVIRSISAKNNIKDIAEYIAKDNPYRAISFIQEMMDNFTSLASYNPKATTQYEGVHCYTYKKYLIFYRIVEEKKEVVILHITHSAQYTAYKNFNFK